MEPKKQLTSVVKLICSFLTHFLEEEVEVDDLFPDYDEEEDEPVMITVKEALYTLEVKLLNEF